MKKKPVAPRKRSNPVDVHIGERLTSLRISHGLTQQGLAELTQISFQQIQKYEKGTNRIAASRLYQFASLMSTPVAAFFEGLPDPETGEPGNDQLSGPLPLSTQRAVAQLARVADEGTFNALVGLIRALVRQNDKS